MPSRTPLTDLLQRELIAELEELPTAQLASLVVAATIVLKKRPAVGHAAPEPEPAPRVAPGRSGGLAVVPLARVAPDSEDVPTLRLYPRHS